MSKANASPSPEKLDSDLLRAFLAVAETGSVTKGADRIFRSQSAASLQIKRLETLLGRPVFERHARGISLTPTGERLRPVARRVVELIDSAVGELRAEPLEGLLRLGIPDEYGETILPEVIARFARDHPLVELALRCGFSPSFPGALARSELDLAVYAVESPARGAELLATERTVWATSRHHLAHEQEPLPVALFDRACWWRDRALEALESSGRDYRVVHSSESVAGVIAAVRAGVAVGLLGEGSIRGNLRTLGPADGFPEMPRSSLVLARRDNLRSSAADAVAAAIRAAFRERDRIA